MDNVINLFHRDILTLRSHHWKYFMNTYTGCSYCCAYCLNAYTNDFYKKIKIDENIVNEIDEKLKNIGWNSNYTLKQGYTRLINYLKEEKNNEK